MLARGCSFSPQSVLVVPPHRKFFRRGPTLRRFAGTPTEGLFRALHRNIAVSEWGAFLALHPNIALSAWAFVRASPSTMSLFRRRNNENSERDVLRHDAYLFGVEPLTNAHLFEASLSTMLLFRRRNYAPLSQTCTAGACACSCKSRRAPRPRKLDGKLSRHGLGARRVALLAPRAMLN